MTDGEAATVAFAIAGQSGGDCEPIEQHKQDGCELSAVLVEIGILALLRND